MTQYEYKVVPAPTKGLKAKGIKTPEGRFANSVQSVLNALAADGWEYLRAELLPSEERSGLTGSTTNWRNVLVFRRPKAEAAQLVAVHPLETAARATPPEPRLSAEPPAPAQPAQSADDAASGDSRDSDAAGQPKDDDDDEDERLKFSGLVSAIRARRNGNGKDNDADRNGDGDDAEDTEKDGKSGA